MAWDKTIPNENNVLRGGGGDIAKMRENFETLDPIVVSGLDGLSGVEVPSPVSGQTLTYNGVSWVSETPVQSLSGLSDTAVSGALSGQSLVYQGGGIWAHQTISGGAASALDDLSDVDTSGVVSGQALIYDGSSWGPGEVTGVRAGTILSGAETIPNGVTLSEVSGFANLSFNAGGWTISGGALVVPSGVSRVDIQGQASWEAVSNATLQTSLYLNGAPLSGVSNYNLDPMVRWRNTGASIARMQQVLALDVPVQAGDLLTLAVSQNSSLPLSVVGTGSGVGATYLMAREAGGGGGGGGGFTANGSVYMADAPPLDPPSYNDEFTGDLSKWTTWDPGSNGLVAAIASGLASADHLQMYLPGTAAVDEWAGIYQDTAALADDSYTFIAKLGLTPNEDSGDEVWYGLVAFVEDVDSSPTTAGWYGMMVHWDGSGVVPGHVGFYAITDYLDETPIAIGTQQDAAWTVPPTTGLYFRLTWEDNGASDRDLAGWLSLDGQNWVNYGHVFGSLGWQPYGIGLVMLKPAGSSTGENVMKCQFIRMQPDDLADTLTLSGARVDLQYSS